RPGTSSKTPFTATAHLNDFDLQRVFVVSNSKLHLPHTGTSAKAWDILPTVLISLLILGVVLYQQRLAQGKGAHRIRQRPLVRFNDVAGIEEAKAEVQEVIDFLRDPSKYNKL